MEQGFFHPQRGYWQTSDEPSEGRRDRYPPGTISVPLKPGPDMEWVGNEWVSTVTAEDALQAEREKMVVSAMQAKLALLDAGLLTQVELVIAGSPVATQIAWENATEFRRTSPTIAALQSSVGLTDEQIDGLFTVAKDIEA